MLLYAYCLCAGLALGVYAQVAEPVAELSGFNVTEALLELDVNVEELPIADLVSRSSNAACAVACASLNILYRDNLIQDNEAAYDQFKSGFWSLQQAEVDPYCVLKAPDATSVSVAILISRLTRCPFAAKSGGHAAFTGASNIEGGITIALENLNSIKVSADKKTVAVGAGNRWANVYSTLAESDLTVIGGRVAPIGVGGLTTGGGISFFSNAHGWACDNVVSYEVTLASGVQTTASATKNPDLYWALRGGGNNFGIVTKFNYEAISLPGNAMWGGTRVYLEQDFNTVTKAFHQVISDSPSDTNAGQWIAWLINGGIPVAATEFWYSKPDGGSAAIWSGYTNTTPIADTTANRRLADYTVTLDASNPYGLRETYYGLTIKVNAEMLDIARDIFFAEVPAVSSVAGVNPVLIMQGITSGQIKGMSKNGGNALGLDPNQPLYLMHVASMWQNASDDAAIYAMISRVLTRIKAEAKKRNANSDYIYMNYAGMYEDVIRGYGKQNQAKLQQIAKKYDPQRVFQELQPGHFKLDRAPVVDSRYFSGI